MMANWVKMGNGVKMHSEISQKTTYIFISINLHVHSWHGTAHGVGRRPHTSIILSDTAT